MPAPVRPLNARNFFGNNGVLSRWHPNYEFRQGQLEMAEAVESAIAERRHLIVEAGTGTGKTLAYLIPAILSGKRVVISTGTRNLQEQLFYKDVPFLQKHFDRPLRVCYMKGRSNFACRRKIYDNERNAFLSGMEEVADFQIIREWERSTETGDRAEIKTLPENSTAWAKVDARRDLCIGSKCDQFERCFLTLMHQRALESDIIIVNHHLFFADLALKDEEYGQIIPDYEAVIFDEAHEIEDVVGQYFGVSLSNLQIDDLRRDILMAARLKKFESAELDRMLSIAWQFSERFFALFSRMEGRTAFREHREFVEQYDEEYTDLLRAIELIGLQLNLVQSQPEEVIPLFRRAQDFGQRLRFWMEEPSASFVYWVERRGRGTFLQATPIDVAPILDTSLFDRVNTVVLTSATLAVAGSFEFTEQRLGVRSARTLIVESPFDFPNQALLYIPENMPDPRGPAFTEAASDEIIRILELSQGRAFVLFTSYGQMRQVYDRVSLQIEYPTLLQGTGPRNALLDEFRVTPNCVLFATSSFWQGVDVQGEQLSCVIIDKLPFAVPSDPVVEARVLAIKESGGNAFYDYQIPQAALALKQGFGRLIRSRTDRGVLSILDNRITRQRYGQVFFDSLPDYEFTTNLKDVERFFATCLK
ncbi:MAG: ATP-dependent DNA helicase [Bryobacteraceae bacterium]|nr:ATP-dependent DNA helicase [Bryobacteraceae bacterium]